MFGFFKKKKEVENKPDLNLADLVIAREKDYEAKIQGYIQDINEMSFIIDEKDRLIKNLKEQVRYWKNKSQKN